MFILVQKRRLPENFKSTSYKLNLREDDGRGNVENGFLHPGVSGSLQTNKVKDDKSRAVPSHSSTTLGHLHRPELRTQMPYMSQAGSAGLSNLSGPLAVRNTSIKLDNHNERPKQPHWPGHRSGSRYRLDVADNSATHHLLERPSSSHKKNETVGSKDSTATVSPYNYDTHGLCL